jgi:hypothetical protein
MAWGLVRLRLLGEICLSYQVSEIEPEEVYEILIRRTVAGLFGTAVTMSHFQKKVGMALGKLAPKETTENLG